MFPQEPTSREFDTRDSASRDAAGTITQLTRMTWNNTSKTCDGGRCGSRCTILEAWAVRTFAEALPPHKYTHISRCTTAGTAGTAEAAADSAVLTSYGLPSLCIPSVSIPDVLAKDTDALRNRVGDFNLRSRAKEDKMLGRRVQHGLMSGDACDQSKVMLCCLALRRTAYIYGWLSC